MILLILVFVGLGIFALIKGLYAAAVFSFLGIMPGLGMISALIASAVFVVSRVYWAAALEVGVILWNLIGLKILMNKNK